MKVIILQDEEMYQLMDEMHNPPAIQNQKEENQFQAEICALYEQLVESLSVFGDEGDYYGISDFAVRPDLRDRPTVLAPPAHHTREFTITILTEEFYRSDYLKTLCQFLNVEAMQYRIQVAQDFDSGWHLTLILTRNKARLNCSAVAKAARLKTILAKL